MEQNKWFEHSFAFAPIGMAVISLNGSFIRVNQAFTRLLGYTDEELLKMQEPDITFHGDRPVTDASVLSLLSGSMHSQPFEKRYIHKLGHSLRVSIEVSLIPGEPEGKRYVHVFVSETPRDQVVKAPHPEIAELLELISEHSKDIIGYGVDRIFRYVSPAALWKLLGYKPEDILGRHVREFLHPEDVWLLSREKTLDEERFNCRICRKDGRYAWFEVTVKSIWDANGTGQKAIYVARDITVREQMLSALRNSQRSLAEAQRIAGLGSWEWDIAADRFTLSDETYRIFESNSLSFDGTCGNFLELIHTEDREAVYTAIQGALAGSPFNLECLVTLKNNRVKHIRMQGVATRNEKRQEGKLHGTVQDITNQKLMLQMLEESVDRYISLKKYNLDGVISLNMHGIITSVNPAAEQISGYTALDLIGMHYTDLTTKEEADWAKQLIQRIKSEGYFNSAEIQIRHRQGGIIDLLVTPAPIFVSRKQVGCYIIAKDITDQKRKDELLLKSEKLTIAGQLAAGVAHEIRNPLTALKGFVQLMSRSVEYHSKYLPIMLEELERIELIINELLMLAKPQAIQMKRADLSAILHDVVLLLGAQAMLQDIEIGLNKPAGKLMILCDRSQIKQVFINFLKNSMESMTEGGRIDVELKSGGDSQGIVRISDQGCGIPKEQLRLIGEPFYSTKESGTGLGLLVSHKIIEHHGGKITIESEINVGTTIEVTLPTASGDMAPINEKE
ncbi:MULTISPECIES: PAS domain S-box protein [unclassified Paenibacillus]|uniref:PAS domain S-box protein n=1 Tax=unclassified Paenibacillus TaxID=185978 RepID=UPI001AE23E82|nr:MULTISPECIES: PAS domain S-box protein [unclassified Paenibacillus]MBP1157343.1 two-component system sporulation sensor kinase A [Paenibacillus sp. PvP091]MBP1171919.1 two-component system sporulation sensor kinase A [Paenibacillus sp. PvR098]MBP2438300.1 two-component system sporulation sensor kinase A [Paenibacillus sp. PvP052]